MSIDDGDLDLGDVINDPALPAPEDLFVPGDDDDFDPDMLDDDPVGEARPSARIGPPMKYYCAGADRKNEDGEAACKYRSVRRWYGACPECRRWYACKMYKKATESRMRLNLGDTSKVKAMKYFSTGLPELDRVLGGGLVLGNTVLLAGSRGTGKSTVLLQAANGFASPKRRVYFASGEDGRDNVVNYAQRLGITNPNIDVYGDPRGLDIEEIVSEAQASQARLLIIDSLQVCAMSDVKADVGQVAQLDACTNYITSFAKQKKVAVIVIGHLTKAHEIAGSEKVQHLVDVLLRFDKDPVVDDEGQLIEGGEMVRKFWIEGKSRQGPETETGLMEMTPTGLKPLSERLQRKMSRLHF
jgi:DNA repair protein RadA/Sms